MIALLELGSSAPRSQSPFILGPYSLSHDSALRGNNQGIVTKPQFVETPITARRPPELQSIQYTARDGYQDFISIQHFSCSTLLDPS